MGKKKTNQSKTASKSAKKIKSAQKTEKKQKKKAKDVEDEDLEQILEKMQKEWEESHTVTEELVEGPPSRRANATLTACPNGNHLWCIGGELFSEDGKAYFYNDVFRYSPEKVEWRKFVSKTCPGPRSAHAVAATPVGGGKIFLFGGEFSSLHQNTFHHYRDFWCFNIQTHSWDRIETKIRPSARSGHRMTFFKHFLVLFGGFYDPGVITKYLNDLWIFDTQEYKWWQVDFKDTDPRPSPRSGFSFLPTPDGIVLHGGYCKEYSKGKRPIGVMLEDTWFLHMSLTQAKTQTSVNLSKSGGSPLLVKWERRKRGSYAPSTRSGCTMTLWTARNTGILFGGVTDEDKHEETLESMFWNDLYGYQMTGKGKWVSMTLRRTKKRAGHDKKNAKNTKISEVKQHLDDDEDDIDDDELDSETAQRHSKTRPEQVTEHAPAVEVDPDDPNVTVPIPRYNAMLAVVKNTLYIYGGIFERGSREYTLDDFYSLHLDKMDRYVCLKDIGFEINEGDNESSSDDDEDDEDDDESDRSNESDEQELQEDVSEIHSTQEQDISTEDAGISYAKEEQIEDESLKDGISEKKGDLRLEAAAFMGTSKDVTRSPEDIISTPLPGETLAMFYSRSRNFWSQAALGASDNRGKQLRRDGFALAEERYMSYKPILEEVEKILAEAGLDEDEMRKSATASHLPPSAGGAQSRNRR